MEAQTANIFLVEDSSDDEYLIRRAMERLFPEIRIRHSGTGEEALGELLAEGAETPNLVLMDVRLPKLSGHEVLTALRRDDRYQRVPLVMLTSSKAPLDIAEAYSNGANGYVLKPLEFDEYIDKIAGMLQYWLKINTC
ncbi:MAG: response regulator [Fimbriimonas sp.]